MSTKALTPDNFQKKVTKLTLIEKIVLKFKKKLFFVNEIECITIVYKKWRGKNYILDYYNNSPRHFNCRCYVNKS
jgi:hypothetical protein